MLEFVQKLGFCVVPSLLVGGSIAWVLSKLHQEKQRVVEIDVLKESLATRDHQFKKLQERYQRQTLKLNKVTDEGIVTRHQLLQKSNLLRKNADQLHRLQSQLDNLEQLEEEKSKLIEELTRLKTLLEEKNKTIKEFEAVLVKADHLLAHQKEQSPSLNQERDRLLEFEIEKLKKLVSERNQKILHYEKEIEHLKNEQKRPESSFLISHDQFKEIEKRLIEYKSRIEILEAENQQLVATHLSKPLLTRNKLQSNMATWAQKAKQMLNSNHFETNPTGRQQELNNI